MNPSQVFQATYCTVFLYLLSPNKSGLPLFSSLLHVMSTTALLSKCVSGSFPWHAVIHFDCGATKNVNKIQLFLPLDMRMSCHMWVKAIVICSLAMDFTTCSVTSPLSIEDLNITVSFKTQ